MNKTLPHKTVLVGGCFDLIHFGHISFLKAAKKCGDTLLVALEADENVSRRKGPTRPIHTQAQRKAMLEAISFVDKVIALPEMTQDNEYKQFVAAIKPSVIVITQGDPYETHKRLQADAIGAKLVVVPKIHTPSTSQLAKLLELE